MFYQHITLEKTFKNSENITGDEGRQKYSHTLQNVSPVNVFLVEYLLVFNIGTL
jgi:hypothetical protein